MPLRKGTSNATRQQNIAEMIHAGHDPRQAVAAAYDEQRKSRAKAGHRSHKMPESAAHAPGREISGEGGAVRQRNRMGEGGSPMGGNFGVAPFHEANKVGGVAHGAHMPHDGVTLQDEHRSGPPAIDMGGDRMAATAHSHHGPHHHPHSMHEPAPKGRRPHHVSGRK